jgi:hypothetical protein
MSIVSFKERCASPNYPYSSCGTPKDIPAILQSLAQPGHSLGYFDRPEQVVSCQQWTPLRGQIRLPGLLHGEDS